MGPEPLQPLDTKDTAMKILQKTVEELSHGPYLFNSGDRCNKNEANCIFHSAAKQKEDVVIKTNSTDTSFPLSVCFTNALEDTTAPIKGCIKINLVIVSFWNVL